MIQAIRRKPKTTPSAEALAIMEAGIPKASAARSTATTIPDSAAIQTRFRRTSSTKKRVRTGRAEASVESAQEPNGS